MDFVDFHGYHYDDDGGLDDGQWAMDIIDAILERAFWQPPKFSSLDKYLRHQYVLLETEIDEAGNPPESVKEADFPANPNSPHTFHLVPGTVTDLNLKQPILREFLKVMHLILCISCDDSVDLFLVMTS